MSSTAAIPLYIFYGSATGNAEHIAKDLAARAQSSSSLAIEVRCCDALEKYKTYADAWMQPLSNGHKYGILIVASTTGNGDAPENAGRFVRYIKRKTTIDAQPFRHVAFAVLGLGDTNYDQFCATGKIIDFKMVQLGGTRAKPLGMADEATGLEDVVEPWINTVLQDVTEACVATKAAAGGGDKEKETDGRGEEKEIRNGANATAAEEVTAQSSKPAVAAPTATPAVTTQRVISPRANLKEKPTTTSTTTPKNTPPPSVSSTPLFILYGSATGNAEHIAKDLASTYETILKNPDAKCFFPSVVCCELDQYKKQCASQWEQMPPEGTKHGILVVTSTTGNGDPPENAGRFVRYIKRKTTVDAFVNCAFAVLALGDTNYDQFCATGKLIDKKMAELRGTRAKPLGMADEATGLEDVVEPWTNTVFMDITNACRGDAGDKDVIVKKDAKTAPSRTISHSSTGEEKKMELDVLPVSTNCTGTGVSVARSLLSLSSSTPIPTVDHSVLPSLGTSLSSCELVHDEYDIGEGRRRSRGMSLAEIDRMTISTASTAALHYTLARPYETSILNASYLTNTSPEPAKAVADLIRRSDKMDDNVLIEAMDAVDKMIPLKAADESDQTDASVYECNAKRVIEMTLSLPDDFTLEYQPGDSLGIVVSNTPQAVQFVLSMLEEKQNVKRSQKISIESNHPITVEEAVRSYIDLCSLIKNKRILHSLSQFATDPDEVDVLRLVASKTPEGEELFRRLIDEQRMSVVDLLKQFPSCQSISLEGLIGMLPGIPPRYYSVSSSPLDQRNGALALTVAFSVVDYLTPSLIVDKKEIGQRRIGGIATRHLEILCSPFLSGTSSSTQSTLKIFPKPTAEFHLPAALSTPLILIGPGTGVAPFVGFLRHRKAQAMQSQQAATSVVEGTWRGDYEMEANDLPVSNNDAPSGIKRQLGKILLFFGCRRADHDWLFCEEMAQLKSEGVVSELYTAFSRQEPKQYVQDIMINDEACRASLAELLLKENASVYVCGDGNQMAKDVQNAIVQVLSTRMDDASAYLEKMKAQKRFVMDIWTS